VAAAAAAAAPLVGAWKDSKPADQEARVRRKNLSKFREKCPRGKDIVKVPIFKPSQ
jgi:hypothetical protein